MQNHRPGLGLQESLLSATRRLHHLDLGFKNCGQVDVHNTLAEVFPRLGGVNARGLVPFPQTRCLKSPFS